MADRAIVYPASIPLETDILSTNKFSMIGLAKLAAAIMGNNTYFNGLTCAPTSPASLSVNIAPGEIYSLQNVDGTAYSSISADTTHSILKQGILMDAVSLTMTAPITSGMSVNYLVQIAYQDIDSNAVALPYYNSANPTQAWSGPNNSGATQNTVRSGVCTVAIKTGVTATTGTQVTPSADTGYVGAYVITLAYGQATITSANISHATNAPFLPSNGIVAGIQKGEMLYAADTGTANVYSAAYSPAITVLADGVKVVFKAKTANTGTSTFSPNGLTAYPIYSHANQALQGGEIVANGLIEVEWNSTLTAWVLCGNSGGALPVLAATKSNHAVNLGQMNSGMAGVVGTSRNASMSVSVTSATATFTADEIIVETALGGTQYRISSFNKTINLATTGAGGMDTGTVPTSGFVALYAIYNPTTSTPALLAVNATSTVATEVYSGSNLPSGYTASALISVWGVAASKFMIGTQFGRDIYISRVTAINTSVQQSSSTILSVAGIIPMNAIKIMGDVYVTTTGGSTVGVNIAIIPAPPSIAASSFTSFGTNSTSYEVPIITTQSIYYTATVISGTMQANINISGYSI